MPDVNDFPHRDWSADWSLDYGPLYFEPPRPPAATPTPVTGAKGATVTLVGDRRSGQSVKVMP